LDKMKGGRGGASSTISLRGEPGGRKRKGEKEEKGEGTPMFRLLPLHSYPTEKGRADRADQKSRNHLNTHSSGRGEGKKKRRRMKE